MKKYALISAVAAMVFFLGSCSKDPVDKLSSDESRLYITNHDSTTDFSSFKTFSVADSVALISNNHLRGKSRTAFDSVLISTISSIMTQRGYTQVTNSQSPDLGINVNNIISSYTIEYANYYGDYGGYLDPYYWGYGGYGYYGAYIGSYQVEQGAISIDMFDLKDASTNKQIKSVWNGIIQGSGTYDSTKIAGNVQALFNQSTYIK